MQGTKQKQLCSLAAPFSPSSNAFVLFLSPGSKASEQGLGSYGPYCSADALNRPTWSVGGHFRGRLGRFGTRFLGNSEPFLNGSPIDANRWAAVVQGGSGPVLVGQTVPDAWGFFLFSSKGGVPFRQPSQVQVLWVEHD